MRAAGPDQLSESLHGMSGTGFDALSTAGHPAVFAYCGYPWLIRRLTDRRHGYRSFSARVVARQVRSGLSG